MDTGQLICQELIHALKQGHVPSRGLERMVVQPQEVLDQIRHDFEISQSGRGWVRFLRGDYGSGKTFLCSLIRELAWHDGFIVAMIDLRHDAMWHKADAIYRRIIEGMRTDHVRHVPAFEFIVQEWLFNLQQDMGWHAADVPRSTALSQRIEQAIEAQLLAQQIHHRSFIHALRTYYVGSHQGREAMAAAAVDWLMGRTKVSQELPNECGISEAIDKTNAFELLQAIARLIVHAGYAGLIVICDEAERIGCLARRDNRYAAYENMRRLIESTAQGAFPHCGFIFAAAEEFFHDSLWGIASYPNLSRYLDHGRSSRPRRGPQLPLIALEGFNRSQLYQLALKVRESHAIAYDWIPQEWLTDALLMGLIEQTEEHFGEHLKTAPRGFLKSLVDLLDELQENPHIPVTEVLVKGFDPNRIEEVERDETHLCEYDGLS
jgi:hypothetical protein